MARSADDLAIGLSAMAGPDEIDGAGYRLALPAPSKTEFKEFKVAVMLDDPNAEVDREVQDQIQKLADFLAKRKTRLNDKARPQIDTSRANYIYIMLLRAATAGRQTAAEFEKNMEIAKALKAEDDGYYARMTRANTMSHREWLAFNEERHKMRWKWRDFFKEYDLLLCPAASSAAFPHDHEGERYQRSIIVNGKKVPTTDQLFWAGYSCVAYLPSTVAPIGFSQKGLPIGVQIVGPQFGDRSCNRFAKLIEESYQAFVAPPGYN